jgi:hypothetical protein
MSRLRTSCLVLAACAGLLVAAAPASATATASSRRLCADRVPVWDSPDGFVIAHMYRPQHVRVLATTDHRRWSLVHFSDTELRGWILTRTLCA